MERAPQAVRQRLVKAATALENAGLQYAVIGGNVVGLWVASVDEAAVRNTRDVDLLVSREQWAEVCEAMKAEGFVFRRAASLDMFLDPAGSGKAVDAVHVIFAGEHVDDRQVLPNPSLGKVTLLDGIRVIGLQELVRMKLDAWTLKDRLHLEDLQGVGLLDAGPMESLPDQLRERYESISGEIGEAPGRGGQSI